MGTTNQHHAIQPPRNTLALKRHAVPFTRVTPLREVKHKRRALRKKVRKKPRKNTMNTLLDSPKKVVASIVLRQKSTWVTVLSSPTDAMELNPPLTLALTLKMPTKKPLARNGTVKTVPLLRMRMKRQNVKMPKFPEPRLSPPVLSHFLLPP